MPRVYEVKKARASKHSRTCRTCGHVIEPGEAYRYFEPRFGPPVMYCAEHYPKRGDMTTSKLGPLYDAQDEFMPDGTLEGVQEALQSIANIAEEIAGEYEESISNMPEGLQDSSPAAEEMREKIDALQSYAQELESFEPDVETFDEDQAREEAEEEVAGEMVEEMDLDEVRGHALIDVDEEPQYDDDGNLVDDPLENMEAKEIVTTYGDEAEYTSRVDARIEEKRETFTEENGDQMDAVYSEASDLVSQFEY
jgi:hypothetical protein